MLNKAYPTGIGADPDDMDLAWAHYFKTGEWVYPPVRPENEPLWEAQ